MKMPSVVLFTLCLFAQPPTALASTVNVSGPATLQLFSMLGDGQPVNINVYTTGNLYIDYAPFVNGNTLTLGSTQITAGGSLSIFTPGYTPTAWPYGTTAVTRLDDSNPIVVSGDAVLFISGSISSAIFNSAGNMVIGDYSAIAPVPLPPAILLLSSGFIFLFVNVRRRNSNMSLRLSGFAAG